MNCFLGHIHWAESRVKYSSSLLYQFSIFEDMGNWQPWNLDNSNSGNSNFPLTRTKFPFLDQNFTDIYPDNSNSLLTWTVFRFPSEFELLGIYCSDNNNNSDDDDDDDDDDDYYKCNKKWWPSRSTSIVLLSFLIKLEYWKFWFLWKGKTRVLFFLAKAKTTSKLNPHIVCMLSLLKLKPSPLW